MKGLPRFFKLAGFSCLFLLTACVTTTMPQEEKHVYLPLIQSDQLYMCDNARQFSGFFDDDGCVVTIMYKGQAQTLPRVSRNPIFSNSFYTLYVDQSGHIDIDYNGNPLLVNCEPYYN